MGRKSKAEKLHAEHVAAHNAVKAMVLTGTDAGMSVAPEHNVHRSEPLRLIDIDIYRYGLVRANVWVREGRTDVRGITLDDTGARQLMLDLIKVLI
jgi:hypothetical protein